MFAKLEEQMIPLKALWAMDAGLSSQQKRTYTKELLFNMHPLQHDTAIILGSTRATAFAVRDAVLTGHKKFVVIGGKAIGAEERRFTAYIEPRLNDAERKQMQDLDIPEKELGRRLLTECHGIDPAAITIFEDDNSVHSSGNMAVLKRHGFEKHESLEFYTLSGFARRALATARKVLGDGPAMACHNAFPTDVTLTNWFNDATARAFMVMEAAKILPTKPGKAPLYVRLGYCAETEVQKEGMRNFGLFETRQLALQL